LLARGGQKLIATNESFDTTLVGNPHHRVGHTLQLHKGDGMTEEDRARDKTPDAKIDEARQQRASDDNSTEKPEASEENKQQAAEMMTAYEDQPTLKLPGTGGAVSGTAVGAWLDEDGNPKGAGDDGAPAAKANLNKGDEGDDESFEDKAARDKEFNKAVIKAAEDRAAASN
jgi:hypothetical protein